MVRRSTIAILFATASLLRAAPCPADDLRDRAAAAFDQGVNRFRLGDSRAALAAFMEAYRLVPDAGILYNIGQTQLALGDEGAAFLSLERFLAEATDVSRARRTEVQRTLRRLRPRVGAVVLSVRPQDADLSVDGASPSDLPPGGVIYLSPGAHRLELSATGHRSEVREVDVRARGEERLEVMLETIEAEIETPVAVEEQGADSADGAQHTRPTPPPSGGVSAGPILLGALSVACFATAAVTGLMALRVDRDIEEARRAHRSGASVDRAAIEDRAATGKTLALVTDIALGAGAVAATVAIILAVKGSGEPGRGEVVGVVPLPGGALVVIGGATP